MQAEVEINKKKEEVKSELEDTQRETKDKAKSSVKAFADNLVLETQKLQLAADSVKKGLENKGKD